MILTGFPQTSLEKFQCLFNDISRQKFPNFHDNSERHKTENHRTTCYAWPPYTPYVHYWVLLRKSVKVFLFHLMNSISVNNTCKIHIYLPRLSVKTTSISEFNDFSMSDWPKIQWIFHDFVILTNFKNFSWNSMILKQIRISMIFQELWEPCTDILILALAPQGLIWNGWNFGKIQHQRQHSARLRILNIPIPLVTLMNESIWPYAYNMESTSHCI